MLMVHLIILTLMLVLSFFGFFYVEYAPVQKSHNKWLKSIMEYLNSILIGGVIIIIYYIAKPTAFEEYGDNMSIPSVNSNSTGYRLRPFFVKT